MFNSFAITLGRWTKWIINRLTGGGSSYPGKVTLALSPHILTQLSRQYECVVITGTNGKTLTTTLTYEIAKNSHPMVISNQTGANMLQGIVATFLDAPTPEEKGLAILEVDEGSLKRVLTDLTPKLFVWTNLFDDQVDRFGDASQVLTLLEHAAKMHPTVPILANGDLPLFGKLSIPNPVQYFGFSNSVTNDLQSTQSTPCPNCQQSLDYHWQTYNHLGDYYCQHCGFKRPELTIQLDEITDLSPGHSRFIIEGHSYELPLGGIYNVYNALAAISIATFLQWPQSSIQSGLHQIPTVPGRQELLHTFDQDFLLNIVKNKVGLEQVLKFIQLEERPMRLVIWLNHRPADGQDTQWIQESDWSLLNSVSIDQLIIGGEAVDTLKLVDLPTIDHKLNELDDLITLLREDPHTPTYLLASYTAMAEIRPQLLSDEK